MKIQKPASVWPSSRKQRESDPICCLLRLLLHYPPGPLSCLSHSLTNFLVFQSGLCVEACERMVPGGLTAATKPEEFLCTIMQWDRVNYWGFGTLTKWSIPTNNSDIEPRDVEVTSQNKKKKVAHHYGWHAFAHSSRKYFPNNLRTDSSSN